MYCKYLVIISFKNDFLPHAPEKYIYVKIPKQHLYIYNDEINFEKHLSLLPS